MELLAWINGQDYPITFGAGFDDQLNETLDSGTIILPHVNSVINMKPYDDVWIHSKNYDISNIERFQTLSAYNNAVTNGKFYHHYLIQNFNRDRIYLDGNYYTYTISLVSEAKGLEACLMPNRNITQPKNASIADKLNHLTVYASGTTGSIAISGQYVFTQTFDLTPMGEGEVIMSESIKLSDVLASDSRFDFNPNTNILSVTLFSLTASSPVSCTVTYTYYKYGSIKSCYDIIKQYVDEYSPKIRVKASSGIWEWKNKYVLDNALVSKFGDVLAPETQFTTPTLRSALSQLFTIKDCLPIVKDNVITYLDISKRGTLFNSITGASWEQYTMDMSQYTDRLRRTYSNALSQNNTTRFVEKMGFRNSNASTMTLDNMRLEFTHPIYKIRSLKLCMYVKYTVNGGTEKVRLNRYDITPLVVQNSIRSFLSEDWNNLPSYPGSFEEMAKYKICTLGYNIGDKYITGWGEKYSYPVGWWSQTKSYFENILKTAIELYSLNCGEETLISDPTTDIITVPIGSVERMVSPASNPSWVEALDVFGLVSDFTQKIKTVFFEAEYEGFIESAVQISKDIHDGTVITNDNTAGSLTIVEKDGLFEKEKANRLGNAAKTISARVTSLSDILNLGDYNSDDEIIYKKSLNIEKDYISVSYYLCKDYVLKNYYTSVWAKERPFALAGYGESVSRDENKYLCLLLSKDKCYYQSESAQFAGPELSKLVSFFRSTKYDGIHLFNDYSINYSLVNDYLVDTQCFTVGNSLCFNIPMTDNITAGNYIKVLKPTFSSYFRTLLGHVGIGKDGSNNPDGTYVTGYDGQETAIGDLTGCVMDWKWISYDKDSGSASNILFRTLSSDKDLFNTYYKDKPGVTYNYSESDFYVVNSNTGIVTSGIYKSLFDMPKQKLFQSNVSMFHSVPYKDGKERINMTFQIDAISDTDDIKISDKFLGMSDLNPNAVKTASDYQSSNAFILLSSRHWHPVLNAIEGYSYPTLSIYIPKEGNLSQLVGTNINKTSTIGGSYFINSLTPHMVTGTLSLGNVISANNKKITIECSTVISIGSYGTRTQTFNLDFYNSNNEDFSNYVHRPNESYAKNPAYVNTNVNGYNCYACNIYKLYIINSGGHEEYIDCKIETQGSGISTTYNGISVSLKNSLGNGALITDSTMSFYRENLVFSGVPIVKNLYWYLCEPLPKYYVPEEVPSGATEISVACAVVENITDREKTRLTLSSASFVQNKSARCYIDGKFVFGINLTSSASLYNVYLSLMDSRSLSVIDNVTGDKIGTITNYVSSQKQYGNQNDYDIISSGD